MQEIREKLWGFKGDEKRRDEAVLTARRGEAKPL
jgi:hypothetical protein